MLLDRDVDRDIAVIGWVDAKRRARMGAAASARRNAARLPIGRQHFGMLVSGVVVEHRVDQVGGRDLALDGIEETDEFEVTVALLEVPITLPSSTPSAANTVVVPCRL